MTDARREPDGAARSAAKALTTARDLLEDRPAAALRHARAAARVATTPRGAAWAEAYELRALQYLGSHREAMRIGPRLASRFRWLGDHAGAAHVLTDLSVLLVMNDDPDGARMAIAEGLASARSAGSITLEADLLGNSGWLGLQSGNLGYAEDQTRAALELTGAHDPGAAVTFLTLAEIDLARLAERPWRADRDGVAAAALESARRGLALCAHHRFRMVDALRFETEALAWSGDADAALNRGMQAAHLAERETGDMVATGRIARAIGLAAAGWREPALGTTDEARAMAVVGGLAWRDARRMGRLIRTGGFGSR